MPDIQQLAFIFDLDNQPSMEEAITWSEEDQDALREVVLLEALDSILDGRNGEKGKKELWDWIYTDDGPFSFDACCKAVGVDPHEMRVTFSRYVERKALHGEAEKGQLQWTAKMLTAYMEEPAAIN